MKTTTLSMFLFIIKIATTTAEEVVATEAAYNGKALTANFHLRCACVCQLEYVRAQKTWPTVRLSDHISSSYVFLSQPVSQSHSLFSYSLNKIYTHYSVRVEYEIKPHVGLLTEWRWDAIDNEEEEVAEMK